MDKLFAVAVVSLLLACSGGAAPAGADQPLENTAPDLQAAQDAACHRVAPKVTDCAIEDARATMSPEEFTDMARDLDELAARNSELFITSCKSSAMSQRQISIYEQCPLDVTCEGFLACTDRANPD